MELLRLCWLLTDGICSKRLAPFLPELLDRLRRCQALREFPIAVQARVAHTRSAAQSMRRSKATGAAYWMSLAVQVSILATLSSTSTPRGWTSIRSCSRRRNIGVRVACTSWPLSSPDSVVRRVGTDHAARVADAESSSGCHTRRGAVRNVVASASAAKMRRASPLRRAAARLRRMRLASPRAVRLRGGWVTEVAFRTLRCVFPTCLQPAMCTRECHELLSQR